MSPDAPHTTDHPAPRVLPGVMWHDPAVSPDEAARNTHLMEATLAAYPERLAWWIWGDATASVCLGMVIEWGVN